MAITAWSAKVVTSSICLSRKRLYPMMDKGQNADEFARARSSGTPSIVRKLPIFACLLVAIFRIRKGVVDHCDPHIESGAGDKGLPPGPIDALTLGLEKLRRQAVTGCPAQIGAIRPEYLSEISAA